MATVNKLPSGFWRVQIRRNGAYASKTFRLKVDAEKWANEQQGLRRESLSTKDVLPHETLGDLIELHRLAHDGDVVSVAWSPDGRLQATASLDNTARIVDASTGKEVARVVHEGEVQAVAWSPDGKFIATGSSDNTARLVEAATGKCGRRSKKPGSPPAASAIPRRCRRKSSDKIMRIFGCRHAAYQFCPQCRSSDVSYWPVADLTPSAGPSQKPTSPAIHGSARCISRSGPLREEVQTSTRAGEPSRVTLSRRSS